MKQWDDPIITNVRRSREALLSDFNGDIHKLIQYLKEQHQINEAVGWKAITKEELEKNRGNQTAVS